MLGRNFRNCFFNEKSVLIEVIVRVMLMQTHSCFWKLETCLRMPLLSGLKLIGYERLVLNKNRVGKSKP